MTGHQPRVTPRLLRAALEALPVMLNVGEDGEPLVSRALMLEIVDGVSVPTEPGARPLDIVDPATGEKWDGPAFDAGFKWGIQHERETHQCGVPTEPEAPDPKWLTIREARELPRDHPGLWTCVCGVGWMGEARGYPDDLHSHATFRVSGGEDGAAHDPGLARFRPDTVPASRPAPVPSARLREAAPLLVRMCDAMSGYPSGLVTFPKLSVVAGIANTIATEAEFRALAALVDEARALAATRQDPEA